MKNTNKCSKCDSGNIIKIPGKSGAYGAGNNIAIGLSTLSSVNVTRYLCPGCGYLEEWIDEKKDIEKIVENFK